jgi:Arc/MetJ-type ribon-helix-helix transcriptional regulator
MKQILVQLDDRLAAELEKVVPGRSHKRSAFIRHALTRALQEELERKTRAAYEKWPDEPVALDPAGWAPEAEAMHPEHGGATGKDKAKTNANAKVEPGRAMKSAPRGGSRRR